MTAPSPSSEDPGHVEIGRQADGHWRWSWHPEEGESLVSTYVFDSPEDAEGEARKAYPGAAVRRVPEQPKLNPRIRKAVDGWLLLALGLGGAAGVGVLAGRLDVVRRLESLTEAARRRTRPAADRAGRPRSWRRSRPG